MKAIWRHFDFVPTLPYFSSDFFSPYNINLQFLVAKMTSLRETHFTLFLSFALEPNRIVKFTEGDTWKGDSALRNPIPCVSQEIVMW